MEDVVYEDEYPPRRSKRGAVMIFVLGWLFLPFAVIVLGELRGPWLLIGSFATLLFIVAFVVAMVRVVRNP